MRLIAFTIVLAMSFLNSCSTSKQVVFSTSPRIDTNFHLYLLVGQSNMAGRGTLDSLSKIEYATIFALDSSGRWKSAVDPIHFDKSIAGVGPGISFAEAMLSKERNNAVRIGLIPCAVGGTSIDLWFAGQQDPVTKAHPYDDAIRRARIAMRDGVLKGILWHQGEGNNTVERAQGYKDKVAKVVWNFRTDLSGNYPFVLGEIGHFNFVQLINEIIRKIPEVVPNSAVVSAFGLKDIGDATHFDTQAARELGRRYAEATEKLLEKK